MTEPTATDIPSAPEPEPPAPAPEPRSRAALALLIGGLGGSVVCLGLALTVGLLSALDTFGRGLGALAVVTLLGIGGLGVPLAWHASQKLRGQPPLVWQTRARWLVIGVFTAVVFLALGQAALSFDFFPNLIVGVAQWVTVLALSAALAAYAFGGWRGLTRLRAWAYALSGAWLGTGLAFLLEALAIVGVSVLGAGVLWAVAPHLMRDLQSTFRTFQFTQDLNVLIPWLTHPGVVAFILLAVAGGVPLLEEALKALGVALTLRRGLTPAMGFYGGVLSGLGFAAVESLLNLSTPQEGWLMLMLARTGTMVVHAFCTGLVGWGWGQLAHTRRPWKLLLSYLGAVLLHGLWNASAIGMSLAGLALLPNLSLSQFDGPEVALVLVVGLCLMMLGGLALIAFAGLGLMGYLLRRGAHG